MVASTVTSASTSASAPSSTPTSREPAEPVDWARTASSRPRPAASMLCTASKLMSPPASTTTPSPNAARTVEVCAAWANEPPTPRAPLATVPVAVAADCCRARADTSASSTARSCALSPTSASTVRDTLLSASAPMPPSNPPPFAAAVAVAISVELAPIARSRPACTIASASTRLVALPPMVASAMLMPTAAPPNEPLPEVALAWLAARLSTRASRPACKRAPLPTVAPVVGAAAAVALAPWPASKPPPEAIVAALARLSAAASTVRLVPAVRSAPAESTASVVPSLRASPSTTPTPTTPMVRPSACAVVPLCESAWMVSSPSAVISTAAPPSSPTRVSTVAAETASASAPFPASTPPPEAAAYACASCASAAPASSTLCVARSSTSPPASTVAPEPM